MIEDSRALSSQQTVRPGGMLSLVIRLAVVFLGVALLVVAIGLWARHGSAVFFDLIASGIAYCF
ncbi:hypothetical protein LGR54_10565 [Ancylobacter sp. Lp-2]|uniref:hypothetical protein n=1 Tax=Ancylobacter sp. Lp-2 TaxID=2881339 RepID=UPI001E36FF9B|nr:hypothetical protein [Ancylobacter sp. Lp-2]MCB4769046.1 hypothetical protein [Ancylobacter sp. Lp-2]